LTLNHSEIIYDPVVLDGEINWVNEGAVGNVTDTGSSCDSSYAFATAGLI